MSFPKQLLNAIHMALDDDSFYVLLICSVEEAPEESFDDIGKVNMVFSDGLELRDSAVIVGAWATHVIANLHPISETVQ